MIMAKKVIVDNLLTDIETKIETTNKVSGNNVSNNKTNNSKRNNNIYTSNSNNTSNNNSGSRGISVRESRGVRALGVSGFNLKTAKDVADYMANLMLDTKKRPFEKKMEMDMCKILYEVLSKEQEKNVNTNEITREPIKIEVVSSSKDEELQERLKRISKELGDSDYQA